MKALRFLILITIILYSCQEIAEIPPVDELPSKICSSIPTRSSNNTYEYYYWCNGVKIPLIEDATRFYVVIKSEKFENIKNSAIDAIKAIKSFDNYASLGIQPLRHTNNSSEHISFLYNISNNSQIALNEDDVVYRAPYFKTMDGYEMGITHILSVQLKIPQGQELDGCLGLWSKVMTKTI